MSERDDERQREATVNDLTSLLPNDGSANAYRVVIAIRELIQPIVDRSIGSSAGMGEADLDVVIGGNN